MNEVKKLGLSARLRVARRAFTGKTTGHIAFGLEIKRCDECERGNCAICAYKQHSEKISKLPDCNDCGKSGHCDYEPPLGEWVRINCPLHEPRAKMRGENNA